ncbi:uncharacterized protein LOC125045340 [Penaeus chinensis]|uniref:uncharacterized protein LOC125045340 n=1 Tax=Penaeus chinensis TaxID=139456 RepID=UPI001FB61F0A|nr:uncharacterized protein LOC125045340 [Penaeus chinensis]
METIFEHILHEESERCVIGCGDPNYGVVKEVFKHEVELIIRNMMCGKAAGPEDSYKHATSVDGNNWRKVTGVICDKRVPTQLKGKVYRVVRPAMMYGLEVATLTQVKEKKLDVREM